MTAIAEWQLAEHAQAYLARADEIPHRTEGEAELLRRIPREVERILDLGTGDGRLLALLRSDRPRTTAVAIDFSPTMLQAAERRFAGERRVRVVSHDLNQVLPTLGPFDAVVSSFAIHHLPDWRKRSLYAEIFRLLTPGGMFANLEHVASPTPAEHVRFLEAIGFTPKTEDKSNQLAPVDLQLDWFRQIGFADVECPWQWMELALLVGAKPLR